MDQPLIVGLGELLWDIFPDGTKRPGGAPFNFAFHCHQLGCKTVMVSRVGTDPLGEEIVEFVRQTGLSTEFIQRDPHHETGQVQVTLDTAGVPSYQFNANPAWQNLEWSDQLEELVKRAGVLCYGSLAMLGQTQECLQRFRDSPSRGQQLHICDLNLRSISSGPWWDVVYSDWLKLSEAELGQFFLGHGERLTAEQEQLEAYRFLEINPRPERAMIVTRGERGATIHTTEGVFDCEPPKVELVDTVGAGDAFTAALACQRLAGWDWESSLKFAVRYAAKVCEHRGGTPRFDPSTITVD